MHKPMYATLVGIALIAASQVYAPTSTYEPVEEEPHLPVPTETASSTEATTTFQYKQPIGPEKPSDAICTDDCPLVEPDPQEVHELKSMALAYSTNAGLSAQKTIELIGTVTCESGWNPEAIGDGGHAFGLAQINRIYHPTVTPEQAKDPEFALPWMAEQFRQGNEYLWTCWRNQYQ